MFSTTVVILDRLVEAWSVSIDEGMNPPYDEVSALGEDCYMRSDSNRTLGQDLPVATLDVLIEAEIALLEILNIMAIDVANATPSKRALDRMISARALIAGLTPSAHPGSHIN